MGKGRQTDASYVANLYDGEAVNMKKPRWTTLCKLLNWSLPTCAFLLFLLIGTGSSITTTHGMSDSRITSQFPHPFDTPTPTATVSSTATPNPTSTPTTSPTPIITPISIFTPTPTPTSTLVPIKGQLPTAIPTPQIPLPPDSMMFPTQTTVTETPTIATPTGTSASPISTAIMRKGTTLKTTLTPQQLSNASEGNKALNTFMLPLSVGAPLLLASGGMFWLIRRRQMNQYKPGLLGTFDDTQPALWVSSRELDANPHALNNVTGASGALPVPLMPQQPHMQTPTSPLSFPSLAYTPSELLALPTSSRQPIPNVSWNQPERYSQEEDRLPWVDAALNLPVQPVEARVFDKYEQVFSPVATPMESSDPSIPLMSSPSWVQPTVVQPIHPPSTKRDSLLGEVMRQAQMGLFVMLGRD